MLQYLDPRYKYRNCREFLVMFRRNKCAEYMNGFPGNSSSLYSVAIFGCTFSAFSFDSHLTLWRTVHTLSSNSHLVTLVMLIPRLQIENSFVLYFL
jgi:hypothetical protein